MDQALLNLHSHSKRKIQCSSEAQTLLISLCWQQGGTRAWTLWAAQSLWKDVCCYHWDTQRADPEVETVSSQEWSVDCVGTPPGRWKEKEVRGEYRPMQGTQVKLSSTFCSAVDFSVLQNVLLH